MVLEAVYEHVTAARDLCLSSSAFSYKVLAFSRDVVRVIIYIPDVEDYYLMAVRPFGINGHSVIIIRKTDW